MTRITADVFNQHIDFLTLETQNFGVEQTKVATVTIAANSPERPESGQALCQFCGADVTCVPYLVTSFKVIQIAVIPIGMGVADDADPFHHSPSTVDDFSPSLMNCAIISAVPSKPRIVESTHKS